MVVTEYKITNDLGQVLLWNSRLNPSKLAVVDISKGTSVTYEELNKRVNRLANALLNNGFKKGDRIAALLYNCKEYIELYLAAAKINAVPVPISTRLVEREIAYVLDDSDAKGFVYGEEFSGIVKKAKDMANPINLCLSVSRDIFYDENGNDLLENALDSEPDVIVDPKGCLFQGYTSGTTGFPKGCVNTHEVFMDHFLRYSITYELFERDRQIAAAPLFHEAPYLQAFTQLTVGGTLYIIEKFNAEKVLKAITDYKITNSGFMVPIMLERMIELLKVENNYDVSSLETLVIGGAALHPNTKEDALKYFKHTNLNEFYGATEVGNMTNVVHNNYPEKGLTCGRPLLGVYMTILDDDGNQLPPNEIGTVYTSGPLLIKEYHKKKAETDSATRYIDGKRWFTLEDMGYLDEEGFLYLVDRRKHLIISGGENIYPAEIENVFKDHPAVNDVAVLGVDDEKWGEVPIAYIHLKPEWATKVGKEEFVDYCQGKISRFKIPKYISFVEEIPRSESGKILKNVIRERYPQK